VSALATAADVAAQLQRPLTDAEQAAVGAMLDAASARFRAEAWRPDGWTDGVSTARLKVNGGDVYLPEPLADDPDTPVQVVDDHGQPVAHTLAGQWLRGVPLPSSEFVTVTYQHQGDIPDDVRQAVAGMVSRVFAADPLARSGVSQVQRTDGPYNRGISYANWAQGGQILPSPEDMRIAAAHRPVVPTVWIP